jgi:hypothetical protein
MDYILYTKQSVSHVGRERKGKLPSQSPHDSATPPTPKPPRERSVTLSRCRLSQHGTPIQDGVEDFALALVATKEVR